MTTDQIIERCSVGLWYLASPYSHDIPKVMSARFDSACEACATLFRAGVKVFSPIAHTHPIAHYGLPKGFEFYKDYDELMIRRCDGVIVLELDGWLSSVGVGEEIAFANGIERPVVYWEREEP